MKFSLGMSLCENRHVTVFDPSRKRNLRGEHRKQELLLAAAKVFRSLGYHKATTNAIAMEAGVSPATLYYFFPNKDAVASALTSMYTREVTEAARAIDPEGELSFPEAINALIDLSISFNKKRPEFHTLVVDAPLLPSAKEDDEARGDAFVEFIATRLRRERPTLGASEAELHAKIAHMVFHGIHNELPFASPKTLPRLHQAMRDAVLRYLTPIVSDATAGASTDKQAVIRKTNTKPTRNEK
jgi:AcrR family transcriptional regulator